MITTQVYLLQPEEEHRHCTCVIVLIGSTATICIVSRGDYREYLFENRPRKKKEKTTAAVGTIMIIT